MPIGPPMALFGELATGYLISTASKPSLREMNIVFRASGRVSVPQELTEVYYADRFYRVNVAFSVKSEVEFSRARSKQTCGV